MVQNSLQKKMQFACIQHHENQMHFFPRVFPHPPGKKKKKKHRPSHHFTSWEFTSTSETMAVCLKSPRSCAVPVDGLVEKTSETSNWWYNIRLLCFPTKKKVVLTFKKIKVSKSLELLGVNDSSSTQWESQPFLETSSKTTRSAVGFQVSGVATPLVSCRKAESTKFD